jgi:rhamnosyltransferase
MTHKSHKASLASIIIRSLNEEKHLGALLQSIQEQDFQDFEIILVDSGSVDQTLSIAKNFKVNIFHIAKEDFTFGRSLNMGVQNAKGEIAVIASAHILPKSNTWLSALLAPFDDLKTALSYGKQRGGEGSKYSEDQHWRHWFPDQSDLDQDQTFCNNANSAIRRTFWEKNPFDEKLTGLEDIAWASWAKEQGLKIAYVAEAEVQHIHEESSAQIINRHRREAIALKQILPQSSFSIWNFVSLFNQKVLADSREAIKNGVFWKESFGIILFRFFQYWGTFKGYNEKKSITSETMRSFYFPPSALEPQNNNEDSGEEMKKSV